MAGRSRIPYLLTEESPLLPLSVPAYNLGPWDPCRDDSGVCELRVGSSISLVQDDEAT